MTEAQAKTGSEILGKLIPIRESRLKYITAFNCLSKDLKEESSCSPCLSLNEIQISFSSQGYHHGEPFPIEELLKLYEYRIKQINFQIEDLEKQLEQI